MKPSHFIGSFLVIIIVYVGSYLFISPWYAYGLHPAVTSLCNVTFYPASLVRFAFIVPSEKHGWIEGVDTANRRLNISLTPSAGLLVDYSAKFDRTVAALKKGEEVDFILGGRPHLSGVASTFLREINSSTVQTRPSWL
jgi:hypothetical protein